jgi:hypothetical protein
VVLSGTAGTVQATPSAKTRPDITTRLCEVRSSPKETAAAGVAAAVVTRGCAGVWNDTVFQLVTSKAVPHFRRADQNACGKR